MYKAGYECKKYGEWKVMDSVLGQIFKQQYKKLC